MELWPIIKLTLIHCGVALAVVGVFAATLYVCGLLFPQDSAAVWWFKKVDLTLSIIAPTALAIIFINSLLRIVLDAIVLAWKGFPNVNHHTIMA